MDSSLLGREKQSDGNKSLAHTENVALTQVIVTAELAAGGVINKKQRRDQEDDIVAFESSNMALQSEVSLPRHFRFAVHSHKVSKSTIVVFYVYFK